MPASVIKTKSDEKMWSQAKKYADKSRDSGDGRLYWGLVMKIFKAMKDKYDGKAPSDYPQRESVLQKASRGYANRLIALVEGKKILVVDDDVDVTELMADVLTDLGFNVDVENDGHKGMAMVKQKKWDIVIIDGHIGSVKGSEINKIAKKTGMKTVSFSGSASINDDDFDHVISKPCKLSQLKDLKRL